MQPKLTVTMVPTDELVPYAGNAKEHPDWQVGQIAASIEQFGFDDPVGIWHNEQGQPVIVEGHGRVLAAKELGIEQVPTIALDHLDDEGRRAYTLAHNKLTTNTGYDADMLAAELDGITGIDMADFGFDVRELGDWFEMRERYDSRTEDGNDEYNEFTEKFEPKKTTDDCYTPDKVYDAVADWVANEYGLDRSKFVRPFYPGGDYESETYPDGCVVVDNPPFSLMVKILRFYLGRVIPFFLFAPTLTLFSGRNLDGVTYIPADCDITYENGARVNTSFITNMEPRWHVRTHPDLDRAVMAADAEARADMAKPVNLKYKYPPYVITAAMVAGWSGAGIEFALPRGGCYQIGALDSQREFDKAIYGSGFLISERAKADAERAKADAERAKALEAAKALGDGVEVEADGSIVWTLSDREREIIASLE